MKHIIFIALGLVWFFGCSAPSAAPASPTVDANAISTRVAAGIIGTQTASAPTLTDTPTPSSTPSQTATATTTYTPTPSPTSPPTDTPMPTATSTRTPLPLPTRTPVPLATAVPKFTPVLKDNAVSVLDRWQVTLLSVRRDKTIFGYFDAETAFGVWATFIFRVHNLQSGSDYIGHSFGFLAIADGQPVKYRILNTVEDKAQYYYSCCDSGFTLVDPGGEKVILITFDVPEATKDLAFEFTVAGVPVYPKFEEPSFDQAPGRTAK